MKFPFLLQWWLPNARIVFSEGFWESLINLPSACSGSRAVRNVSNANSGTSQTQSREEEVTMLRSLGEIYPEPNHSPQNCQPQIQTTSLTVMTLTPHPHCSNSTPIFPPSSTSTLPHVEDTDNEIVAADVEESDDENDDEDEEIQDDDDFVYRISWKSPGKSLGIKTRKDLLYSWTARRLQAQMFIIYYAGHVPTTPTLFTMFLLWSCGWNEMFCSSPRNHSFSPFLALTLHYEITEFHGNLTPLLGWQLWLYIIHNWETSPLFVTLRRWLLNLF